MAESTAMDVDSPVEPVGGATTAGESSAKTATVPSSDVDMRTELAIAAAAADMRGAPAVSLSRDRLTEFLTQVQTAEFVVSEMKINLRSRQKALLDKAVADSIEFFREYNAEMGPIIDGLASTKDAISDMLLGKLVTLSVAALEGLRQSGGTYTRGKRWGMQSSDWARRHMANTTSFQMFHIPGEPIPEFDKSSKPSEESTTLASAATGPSDSDGDSLMSPAPSEPSAAGDSGDDTTTADATTVVVDDTSTSAMDSSSSAMKCDPPPAPTDRKTLESTLRLDGSLPPDYYGERADLVLKEWMQIRGKEKQIRKSIESSAREKLIRKQKEEQRAAAANTLSDMVPWLTKEQCKLVMEKKDDNIEQAMNFCLQGDPTAVMLAISDWGKAREKASKSTLSGTSSSSDSGSTSTGTTTAVTVTAPESGTDADVETDPSSTKDSGASSDPTDGDASLAAALALSGATDLQRMTSDGMIKRVTLRVQSVERDGSVIMQGVLDRNSVPLDPETAPLLKLSMEQLIDLFDDLALADQDTVARLCTENVLEIVFQAHDPMAKQMDAAMAALGDYAHVLASELAEQRGRSSELEFVPIAMRPRVRDTEYVFDFDSHTKPVGSGNLKRVSHKNDGPVLFRPRFDDGTELGLIGHGASLLDGGSGAAGTLSPGGTTMSASVELYTQILDESTLNIVMFLCDDMREDITVDVKNLTHTDASIDEFVKQDASKFGRDISGRKLAYRILVKDSKVGAVLTVIGGEIKQVPFIEHSAPKIGDLVTIVTGGTGVVKCIPTGLIVTNDPRDDFKAVSIQYSRVLPRGILRKHVADCHGYIDLDVVCDANGEWRLSDPLRQAHNITTLALADEMVRTEMMCIEESLRTEVTGDLNGVLDEIEGKLLVLREKKYANIDAAKLLLNETNDQVKSAKKMFGDLKEKHQGTSDESIVSVLQRSAESVPKYERELRALRFEIAM